MLETDFDESCDDACPVRKTADILEHKWATLIVRDLLSGKKRYSRVGPFAFGYQPQGAERAFSRA